MPFFRMDNDELDLIVVDLIYNLKQDKDVLKNEMSALQLKVAQSENILAGDIGRKSVLDAGNIFVKEETGRMVMMDEKRLNKQIIC